MVQPVKYFRHPQILAVRAAGMIDPAFFIQSDRFGYEGVIVRPVAD